MAEVFISYSKLDRSRAKIVADCLQAEGFRVWWDRELLPGDLYDTEIEKRIAEAKCVIVLWSANSVGSKWVRSEATDADDRKILLPIALEEVRLPLAFRLNQTEALFSWSGERNCEPWQRVLLQVHALTTDDPERRRIVPESDHAPATSNAHVASPPSSRESALQSTTAPLVAFVALAYFLATWGWGVLSGKGTLAVALALAVLAFLLFRIAERDISPHMKALATRWLLPRPGEFQVNTAEALNHIFEAIFGKNHFTAECFVKSTLISTAFLTTIILLAVTIFGSTVHHTAASTIGLLLFGFTVNAIGDYIALYKTRLLLRQYKAGMNLLAVMLIDIVSIFAIFFAFVTLAILLVYGISYSSGGRTFAGTAGYLHEVGKTVWLVAQQPLIDLFGYNPAARFPQGDRVLIYSMFITMLMTSIWFWLALILTPIIRVAVWSRAKGLTFLGVAFDVHRAPLTAMGYFSAFLILFAGTAFAGAEKVLAAIKP